jgi:[1-hydroxy-2-(trimethylamino)ethyl]phosphonate dioxygenase
VSAIVDQIIKRFRDRGEAAYIGEEVSQTEHALQAAWLAEKAAAGPELITAALLHDFGHLLHHLPEDCAQQGIDDHHEQAGARWLMRYFSPGVTEPIRLHVAAKRYLCSVQPGYCERLSDASRLSLQLQGGLFSRIELEEFRQNAYWQAAVDLRQWDEQAKVKGLRTPDLDDFKGYLEKAAIGIRPHGR